MKKGDVSLLVHSTCSSIGAAFYFFSLLQIWSGQSGPKEMITEVTIL
ncbi:MAG: hypothetical protein GY707_16050 [Desulfobacteraceae bacterium]|nr:hypothetical protein [Desulfobacteraceae bacterium]